MTKLASWAARSIPTAAIALTIVSSLVGCAPNGPAEAPSAGEGAQIAPVAMYMTEWCPVCRQARKWLDERGYDFVEHDVERDPRAAVFFVAVNPRGSVPTFDVGGQILIGFDPERLGDAREAVALLPAQALLQDEQVGPAGADQLEDRLEPVLSAEEHVPGHDREPGRRHRHPRPADATRRPTLQVAMSGTILVA